MVALSLSFGLFEMVERLMALAFSMALATLESLGIHYGARHT